MASESGQTATAPPWGHRDFLSEEGLRAAQEYYFQTHATHSRLIAQARNAQGMSKAFLRRKLTRELGEDFKMYTGTQIGEAPAAEGMASLGIRGELNGLLKHIYSRIAPNQAITSPIQEDLTILQHAHGALEVCYALVFYYGSLMRQYASFAANRRKVLKSIMDEELFKWVWRLVIGFMLLPDEKKASVEPSRLSAGLSFISQAHQQAPLGSKLHEFGMFLLGPTLKESHLRVPLCYYFVVYLRQLQTVLALRTDRRDLDSIYSLLTRRGEGEPIEHPLVAVDVLLHARGEDGEGFDDIAGDDGQVTQYIPDTEVAFIDQFENFGNAQQVKATLRKLLPDIRRESVEGEDGGSLMPLLLSLRVMPNAVRDAALAALPVPLLNMVRNRITNTHHDVLSGDLADAIRDALKARRGEAYTVHGQQGAGRAAVATSVRVAPPKGGGGASASAGGDSAAQPATPAAAISTRASAPSPPAAAAGETAAGNATAAPATAVQATASRTGYLDVPSVLAWRAEGARIATICLTARELFTLVGPELRCLVPWVVFTLRTGQVFGLAPDRVSKERVEQLVQAMRRQAGDREGTLPAERVAKLLGEIESGSHAKLLLGLVRAAGVQSYLSAPDALAPTLASIGEKFAGRLLDFLRRPNDDAFADLRDGLTAEERQTLAILQRVARAQ